MQLALSQKVPYEGAQITQNNSCREPCVTDVLCNWEVSSQTTKMRAIILGPTVLQSDRHSQIGKSNLRLAPIDFWISVQLALIGEEADYQKQRTLYISPKGHVSHQTWSRKQVLHRGRNNCNKTAEVTETTSVLSQ